MMATTQDTSAPRRRRRRSEVERSIARILDAALDALASDPDASMTEIARQAGVVRATVYVHFPTREALLEAVTDRAVTEVANVIDAAKPDQGAAREALARVVRSAWRTLGRYHTLVAINTQLPYAQLHAKHGSVLTALAPLIERGQADGAFRADVSSAWHLAMVIALIHAASAELQAGRVRDQDAEAALVTTVLGAVSTQLP